MFRASGSYLDARMIGSTVRLVVQSAPVFNFPPAGGASAPNKAANQKVINAASLSAWLPEYSVTVGSTTTKHAVPCGQVSHPADYTGASMMSIYTLDMDHLADPPAPVSIAADGDTVYASKNSLYITSNPNWYGVAAPVDQTLIHRLDIGGTAEPTYLGSGRIPGRLLSQYSLSEYNGSLRIATTTGEFGAASQSSVYVLTPTRAALAGHIGGLGKGEQLYAVRFLGPLAYVVTFRQTDPLYTLDLSDPKAPKTVGTLKIQGYSDYLHDAGGGRLIGVGQATTNRRAGRRSAGLTL